MTSYTYIETAGRRGRLTTFNTRSEIRFPKPSVDLQSCQFGDSSQNHLRVISPTSKVTFSLILLIRNKKHNTYRCRSARAFGCKTLFSWGLPSKIGVWGHLGGQKLYHRIARPRFAILPCNHLNISNRFRVISLHHFVTYIHTYIHTDIHTRNLDSIMAILG